MSQIQQLTNQIEEIETQASQLDATEYEELYKLLIVAYYHAKDIIELMKPNMPVVDTNALEVRLQDAEDALLKAESLSSRLQLELDNKQKDMKNILEDNTRHKLEIEALQNDIERYNKAVTAASINATEILNNLRVI